MTQSSIARKIAEDSTVPFQTVNKIIDMFFDEVANGLMAGDTVSISKFGSLSAKTIRGGRGCYNFSTGTTMVQKPSVSVIFAPSDILKKRLND